MKVVTMALALAALVFVLCFAFRPHPLVGVRVLPDLNIDEVARVDVDGSPILSLQEGKWCVDAYDGYPADGKKVAEFFHSLTKLTVWEVEDDQKKVDFIRRHPFPLTLRDSFGRVLAELVVGEVKHGIGHQGWVESTFTVDGSYLLFSNEVVAVREQFKMFHGHYLCFEGFSCNDLGLALPPRGYEAGVGLRAFEYRVSIEGEDEVLSFAMRGVPTNRWRYALSCEIPGLQAGESANMERVQQFFNDLCYVHTWNARNTSRFSEEERLAARRKRIFNVYSSDGESSHERTFTLYEGKSETHLEMNGWVYPLHKNTTDALFVSRWDLVLSGRNAPTVASPAPHAR